MAKVRLIQQTNKSVLAPGEIQKCMKGGRKEDTQSSTNRQAEHRSKRRDGLQNKDENWKRKRAKVESVKRNMTKQNQTFIETTKIGNY